MSKYKLIEENYKLIKSLDLSEMGNKIAFDDERKEFSTNDIDLLLIILNEAICAYGLDENQDCTEYGWRLYSLYDEVYYQKVRM